MSNFLEGYEDVNARITRIHAEFPSCRIITHIEDIDVVKGYVLVKAEFFKEYEDHVPSFTDYALEMRSDRGVNLHFWVENGITSAIGRVIGLASPSKDPKTAARPTRQDMEKVERLSTSDVSELKKSDAWTSIPSWDTKEAAESAGMPTLGTAIEDIKESIGEPVIYDPLICRHGQRNFRSGVSKKTNKSYGGWYCPNGIVSHQCEVVWGVLDADGKWQVQK